MMGRLWWTCFRWRDFLLTANGGMYYCHPGIHGLLYGGVALRQLRGEWGERRVKLVEEAAIIHGIGRMLCQCAVLLEGPAPATDRVD